MTVPGYILYSISGWNLYIQQQYEETPRTCQDSHANAKRYWIIPKSRKIRIASRGDQVSRINSGSQQNQNGLWESLNSQGMGCTKRASRSSSISKICQLLPKIYSKSQQDSWTTNQSNKKVDTISVGSGSKMNIYRAKRSIYNSNSTSSLWLW